MTHLIQVQNASERRVAVVEEPRLHLLNVPSVYHLVSETLRTGLPTQTLIDAARSDAILEYDPIYNGQSDWILLPPLDHPDPAHCLITGTGLTHLGSTRSRHAMHEASAQQEFETDSMKMFRWGLEGGKPADGQIGIAPEWFYKGTGAVLRAHNQPLDVPAFGEDGGEEAEIAGLYIIDDAGNPIRIGMAQGNEFSDHIFEKKNYLNLAGSKLRTCALGPELALQADFSRFPGHGRIIRPNEKGVEEIIWSKPLATGESEMCHSLANLEHHHFKFPAHRQPGDIHIHFLGACALSFGDGLRLQDGDIMHIHFKGFGRPLRNPLRTATMPDSLLAVKPLP